MQTHSTQRHPPFASIKKLIPIKFTVKAVEASDGLKQIERKRFRTPNEVCIAYAVPNSNGGREPGAEISLMPPFCHLAESCTCNSGSRTLKASDQNRTDTHVKYRSDSFHALDDPVDDPAHRHNVNSSRLDSPLGHSVSLENKAKHILRIRLFIFLKCVSSRQSSSGRPGNDHWIVTTTPKDGSNADRQSIRPT